MTTKDEDKPTIRYRTEAFSGMMERDAAEVMAFETFELGNTDILETLQETLLKDSSLRDKISGFIRELEDNGYVDDMSSDDKVIFFREVLEEINKVTGLDIKYALWLADMETVIDFYGRDMMNENDYESYEIGPVVLSELGYDGTLYGYVDYPVSLEEQLGVQPLEPKPDLDTMIRSARTAAFATGEPQRSPLSNHEIKDILR